MKIFGRTENNENLMMMQEIAFQSTPEELRQISEFLLISAEKMEKHGKDFGHDHYKKFLKINLNSEGPDIIVSA